MANQYNPYNYEKLQEKFNRLNRPPRLTVKQIADQLGVTKVYVYKILKGERWHEPMVRKVAHALGVPWKELVGKGTE